MRSASHKVVVCSLLVLVSGILAPSILAQAPPVPPPPETSQPPAEGPKVNKEEEDAYKSFYELKADDPRAIIGSGEGFLKKFPDSRYIGSVYAKLAGAYQNNNDEAKMFAAGEKAIELDPNNVDALALMAYTIPRRVKPGDLDTDQKLQKATAYANHAIELLGKLEKPAGMTDEDFAKSKNAELASCRSGLAMVDYYQHDMAKMISDMEQATQLSPDPNPSDEYLLGFAYLNAGRAADAVAPLTKCGSAPGVVQDRCKSLLAQAKAKAANPPNPK